MRDATSDDAVDDHEEGSTNMKPEAVLARAVWRDQLKERGIDPRNKQAILEDWKAKRAQYVSLSRRILRHLTRQGYTLGPKAE